jgi:hypothetical protein
MILGTVWETFPAVGRVKISKKMLKPRTIRRLLIGYLKANPKTATASKDIGN